MVTQARRGDLVLPAGRPVVVVVREGRPMHGAIVCAHEYDGPCGPRVLYRVRYDSEPEPGYAAWGIWAVAAMRNPDGSEITTAEWPPPLAPDEPLGAMPALAWPGDGRGLFAVLASLRRAAAGLARRAAAFFLRGWNGGRT